MSERISQDGDGITLAVLTGVDTTTYRATATYLDTGGTQICTFAPSGGHGEMPLEGSLCAVYRKGQFLCQFIKELSDYTPTTQLSVEQRLAAGSELRVGTVPILQPGEMFIGRLGKAVFDNAGSVSLSSQTGSMKMELNDKTQRAYLGGNNMTLSTPDTAIRILTASSIPSTYGDSIRIEKNIPLPYTTPDELALYSPAAVIPSLSYIEIDHFNAITASVLVPGPAIESQLELDELGSIRLGHTLGYFNVDAVGDVTVSGDGTVVVEGVSDVTVSSDKNVGISGRLSVTVSGSKPGFNVLLNPNVSGQHGVARVNDTTISTTAEDSVYWLYITQLQLALLSLSTALQSGAITPLDGGASYKASIAAALIAVPFPVLAPSSLTSRINIGSQTVTAGD